MQETKAQHFRGTTLFDIDTDIPLKASNQCPPLITAGTPFQPTEPNKVKLFSRLLRDQRKYFFASASHHPTAL